MKLVTPTAHRTSQKPSGSMAGLRKMRLKGQRSEMNSSARGHQVNQRTNKLVLCILTAYSAHRHKLDYIIKKKQVTGQSN